MNTCAASPPQKKGVGLNLSLALLIISFLALVTLGRTPDDGATKVAEDGGKNRQAHESVEAELAGKEKKTRKGGASQKSIEYHWFTMLLVEGLTSWTAVYIVMFAPGVMLLSNFLFGDCSVAQALERKNDGEDEVYDSTTGKKMRPKGWKAYKNKLGITSVYLALIWQYLVRCYGPGDHLRCDIVMFLLDWGAESTYMLYPIKMVIFVATFIFSRTDTSVNKKNGVGLAADWQAATEVLKPRDPYLHLAGCRLGFSDPSASPSSTSSSSPTDVVTPPFGDLIYYSLVFLIVACHIKAAFHRQNPRKSKLAAAANNNNSSSSSSSTTTAAVLPGSHCSKCRYTMDGMDHHCYFLHNCVTVDFLAKRPSGEVRATGNHRWFLGLIVATLSCSLLVLYENGSIVSENAFVISAPTGSSKAAPSNEKQLPRLVSERVVKSPGSLLNEGEEREEEQEAKEDPEQGPETKTELHIGKKRKASLTGDQKNSLDMARGLFAFLNDVILYRWLFLGGGFILTLVMITAGGYGLYWYCSLWYGKGMTTLQWLKRTSSAMKGVAGGASSSTVV